MLKKIFFCPKIFFFYNPQIPPSGQAKKKLLFRYTLV